MNKIIDTFYNGSLQNNNYTKHKLTNNKFSSPNLLENRYNKNNNYNQRYENGQRIMNDSPMPRTQYSMGLQVPTITGRSPVTHYSTLPYQTINPYSTLKKNYSENIFKLNILNNRINQLEEENKRDRLRINRLMEGSTFSPNENNNLNRTVFNSNPNYIKYLNNPNNLDEAMDNLRNPFLSAEEMAQKQAIRREQVQFELDKARQRINEERINNEININREKNYTISNYSEESEEEDDEVSSSSESNSKSNSNTNGNDDYTKRNKKLLKKLKKMEKKKDRQRQRELDDMEEKVNEVLMQNHYNNEELHNLRRKNEEMMNNLKQKNEADDFMNNIPDHVALQLQNDNFKMRSNINSIKEGFKEIRNDLENKLEALEMKQNLNFEVIRRIIEQGGNKKLNAGMRKYIDGEEIDLNNIKEDFPEYIRNLPALIDRKIQENEERKREEKNKILNEDINKKYDLMEYKYGYANSFYDYKNNHRPPSNDNKNFVISKNYGRFQYIPNNTKKNMKKTYNSFRQNAEQNLKIIKEKEKKIPGLYAYGVGDKNMDNYIPIKMNGRFDDWYKVKKSGNDNGQQEFQVLESGSDVGINAIKKRVNSNSHKSESKTEKSKKSKKKKEKSKSEKSVSVSKSKSSKESKSSKSKKEKSEKSDKSKKKKKTKSNKDDEDENESNEEEKDDDDKNEESGNKGSNEENENEDSDEKDSDDDKDSDEKDSDDDKDSDDKDEDDDDKDSDDKDDDDDKDSDDKDDDDNNDDEDKSDDEEDS